ncbi:hypothetical protein [Thalassotalea aquiviva]|uniref:hypothetical protein n=1 Tax=Thalassotalea aquiviva TaxID=3242415 RepID=UPI00352A2C25
MWSGLSNYKKIIIVIFMILVAPFWPELISMLNIGASEIIIGVFILFLGQLFSKIQRLFHQLKHEVMTFRLAWSQSAIVKPQIFFTQAIFYSFAVIATGSLVYASVFILPALLFNNIIN